VAYDHFNSRSDLLIKLYRWIDTERIDTFRKARAATSRSLDETIASLADACVHCAADLTGEFHIVGAALAESPEMAEGYGELLGQSVAMFVTILQPFGGLSESAATCLCTGQVGAGEALSVAIVRGKVAETDAIATFTDTIRVPCHKQIGLTVPGAR